MIEKLKMAALVVAAVALTVWRIRNRVKWVEEHDDLLDRFSKPTTLFDGDYGEAAKKRK